MSTRRLPIRRLDVLEHNDDVAILILAGGEATRLPGKLTLDADGVPLLVRVYRNLTSGAPEREIKLACNAAHKTDFETLLPIPIVVDRWARCGPLGGMLSGFEAMRARRVFVAAGDAPFLDAALAERLAAAWEDGGECVVPQTCTSGLPRLEPLAALYDRTAFLREGSAVLRDGRGAVVRVIERLRTKLVTTENPRTFANINTPEDYAGLIEALAFKRER